MRRSPEPPEPVVVEAETATLLQRCLDRLAAGDPLAKNDLLMVADAQFRKRVHLMLRKFGVVRQSYDTGDVVQEASLRLIRTLDRIQPEDPRRFLGLVGLHIRRTLIDLYRHCRGPESYEANRASGIYRRRDGELQYHVNDALAAREEPDDGAWERLHEAAQRLEGADQELFHLRWFLGMTHAQIAAQVGCSEKTVKRNWNRVKDVLQKHVSGEGH